MTSHKKKAALILAGMFIALAVGLGTKTGGEDPTANPPEPEEASVDCNQVRKSDICQTVETDYGTMRYGYDKADGDRVILVDIGGPGLSVLNNHYPAGLRESLPPELQDADLVYLEEPWVTKTLTENCKTELTSYYQTVRTAGPEATNGESNTTESAKAMATECDPSEWSWSAERYASATEQIATDNGIKFDGFIGLSFGAQRFAYLAPTQTFNWAWLIHPAPVASDAADFLQTRVDGWNNIFKNFCGPDCSTANEINQEINNSLKKNEGLSEALPKRSVDVNVFDLQFAFFGLANSDPKFWDKLPKILENPTEEAETIAALSDAMWTRIGKTELSPAHLSYLGEVCSLYTNWDDVQPPESPVGQSLWLLHRPCTEIEPTTTQTTPGETYQLKACLAGSTQDPVSTEKTINQWSNLFESPTVLMNTSPGHSGTQAQKDCGQAKLF